ncbi:uncharacterized protein N7484_002166 [Penicillium longicatenatum]|uniref:uncharacterized protein n=1 Tax=Penicillium longicatenatum TaxID=1561947 RepID=UPI00254970BE|nr:uncharacterized protein N7484_002166 [Penicillium longicatenatum]KAJ5658517.1 hypothetical protein N7484_002166 [Penicillium longicatenatum]
MATRVEYEEPGISSAEDYESTEYTVPVHSQRSYLPERRAYRDYHSRRKEINLAELRGCQEEEPDDLSSGSGIIWHANFFHRQSRRREAVQDLENPDFIFVDTRPIELSVDEAPTQPQGKAKERIQQASASWNGPVITIEVFVETDLMPRNVSELLRNPRTDQLALKRVSRRRLVVNSKYLASCLREIIGYYPSFHSMMGKLDISEPYAVLHHYFDSIEAMAGSPVSATMCKSPHDNKEIEIDLQKKHIQILLDFLRPIREERILRCEETLSEPTARVAFDMIWYLLKPGMDVYFLIDGSPQAGVIIDVKCGGGDSSSIWGPEDSYWWFINLWRLETDGSRVRRGAISVIITFYAGLREVKSLSVCPCVTWDAHDNGERRKNILCRSVTLFKALRQGNLLVDYNGPILGSNQYYTGKLVIDHRRGQEEPDLALPAPSRIRDYSDLFKDYDNITVNDDRSFNTRQEAQQQFFRNIDDSRPISPGRHSNVAVNGWDDNGRRWSPGPALEINDMDGGEFIDSVVDELTEHQLLLLCPEALAYALKHKQWILISLDHVQESVPSSESLSNLVIGEAELKTIKALSNRQNSKTKHCVVAGPPGVGKTYTVEAISEWLHRPLLALTVADIGTVETLVEGELLKWFNLAEAWNAVLLVDEADIFLERRQNRDLARNGLVSASLRRMEYFKGLLFLTTNRVGQIDDAFISRVHIAIGYPSLSEDARRKVWNGFFRKLVRDRAGKIQIAPDAKAWVLETAGDTQLNGRDIRNALQTAITLAEFESEEDPDYDETLVTIVTKAHFQNVLDMCNRFRTYVTSIRREDEKKRAQGRGDRNDFGRGAANEMESLVTLSNPLGR